MLAFAVAKEVVVPHVGELHGGGGRPAISDTEVHEPGASSTNSFPSAYHAALASSAAGGSTTTVRRAIVAGPYPRR